MDVMEEVKVENREKWRCAVQDLVFLKETFESTQFKICQFPQMINNLVSTFMKLIVFEYENFGICPTRPTLLYPQNFGLLNIPAEFILLV